MAALEGLVVCCELTHVTQRGEEGRNTFEKVRLARSGWLGADFEVSLSTPGYFYKFFGSIQKTAALFTLYQISKVYLFLTS